MSALQTHAQQFGAHGVAALPEAACDLPGTVAIGPEFPEKCNARGIPHALLSYTEVRVLTISPRSGAGTHVDLPFDSDYHSHSRAVIAEDPTQTFQIQTARQAMVKPFPSKTHIGNHMLHPETLMLNYGYDPQLSEGAVKPPVFLTSTFVFRTAEDGQDFFDFVSGRREPPAGVGAGLVYSRFNHPNSEIVEDRLAVYERTENLRAVLVRDVGDCDHDPRVRTAGRRDPAFAAALWRHRNAACEDACRLLDRRGGLCRRHRRSRGRAGGGGRHAQRPGCDDFHRNPGKSHQRPGRYRDGPPRRRDDRRRLRATRRSSRATIRCSGRCSSGRSNMARIFRCTR